MISAISYHHQTKLNQSLLFLSPRRTNTIIREERADKKATALSKPAFLSAPGLCPSQNKKGEKTKMA
ncbi:MAG: hypothetical protein IKW56_02425, partial [Methanocorpusculum sp.]|nr:hypothetical protein [Methanocorpusculum sp.]